MFGKNKRRIKSLESRLREYDISNNRRMLLLEGRLGDAEGHYGPQVQNLTGRIEELESATFPFKARERAALEFRYIGNMTDDEIAAIYRYPRKFKSGGTPTQGY